MPLTLREYGRMLDGGGRRESPDMVEYSDDWTLVRRYTFRWVDIDWREPARSKKDTILVAEPVRPGTGEAFRSPMNASPFHLYPVEEQEVRRDRVRDSSYGVPEVRELTGVDAAVRDDLMAAYDDLDAVYKNHVEVVPFRMEIVHSPLPPEAW